MTSRIKEIEIPKGNIFANDTLRREQHVRFIAEVLEKTSGPFVIAMDSPWGTGKTSAIGMLKALMEEKSYKCLYFNAWKADHIADPLIPLIAQIVGAKDPSDLGKSESSAITKVKKTAGTIGKIMLNVGARVATAGILNADDVTEAVVAEAAGKSLDTVVDAYLEQVDLYKRLREELGVVVSLLPSDQQNEQLIFFIDELDRCRPTFAVDLLERVKHIFDIDKVVFVLSVDASQMAASVKSVYGEDIDSHGYLQRFFDLTISLPPVQSGTFVRSLIEKSDFADVFQDKQKGDGSHLRELDEFVDVFSVLADLFGLSLRDKERCITRLGLVIEQVGTKYYLHPIYVAIFIVLRAVNHKLFRAILDKAREPMDFGQLIKEHPRYKRLYEDHPPSFEVIDDYLLVADMDMPKAKAEFEELREVANRKDDNSYESQAAAGRLGELSRLTRNTPRGNAFYRNLERIDLAGSVT